jgi:hypothetical protein
MNDMIQGPFCREQMADLFSAKGKELTALIKEKIREGGGNALPRLYRSST